VSPERDHRNAASDLGCRDQSQIISQASRGESLNILEAGCGRHWPYDLTEIKHTLTGVDVDKEALEARKNIL
jgi:hypothetical protein